MDFMRAKGRSFGRSIGAEYAEGFNQTRAISTLDRNPNIDLKLLDYTLKSLISVLKKTLQIISN